MSNMGLVRTQLGLIWVPIIFNIFVSKFQTHTKPIQHYIWALMLDWAPVEIDQEAIQPIKSIKLIEG